MKRVLIALLALLLPALVQAQTIVGTAPLNDNSRKAASTEFVRALIAGLVPEAPSNGIYYFRRNSGWTAFAGPTTDAPNDGQTYCRSGLQWAACGSGGSASVTNASVLAAIGYTPVSRTGDTFTGGVTVPYVAGSGSAVGSTLQNFPSRPNNQVFFSGTGPQISDCNTFENCPAKTLDSQFVQALVRGRSQKDARYDEYTLSLDSYFNTGLAADWAAGTAYTSGMQVVSGPNLYVATSSGTSGGSAPSGTGTFNDGGVNWQYQVRPAGGEKVGISSLVQAGPGTGKVWGMALNTVFLPGARGLNRNGIEADYSNLTKPCATTAVCYGFWQYGFTNFPITANYTQSTDISTPAVDVPLQWQPNHLYTITSNGSPIVYNAGQYYFLTKAGTSAGSGGPTGSTPYADIADNDVIWHWYDTDGGYYNGSPYMGGAAYYGMLFQNANTIQHTVIYDATKAWYGYQGAPEARHEGSFIRDRSTSKISYDFAGTNSDYSIRDVAVSPTFAYIHGTHSFAGIFDDSSAVAFRSAGTHSGSAFSDTSTTPVSLALGGTYANYGIQDTSTTPTFLYVHGAHSFAGVYDDSSAVAFRSAGTHSSAAMLDSSTSPVGLALSGTYSSAQITGNAFSVGPSGALAAASVNLAQGNKLNLKPGDASIYSPAGTNNFAFDMGSYRVLTMVGGNPNGMRIDSAGTNFPPNLSVIGPDANMSMVQTVKGSGNFAFSNSSVASFITPGSASLTTSSDVRLKRDITDTGRALPRLLDMRIRDYVWRSSGKPATGVIAQELRETHPEMVHKGQGDMLAVDAPNPWLLVKAIQELKADNDNLRRRVERLERRRR